MTEQDTSFINNGDSMHDTSDELNTPNISPEKEIPKDGPDSKDDLCNSSFIFQENSYVKPGLRTEEPETPIVVKKEKSENGDTEKEDESSDKTQEKPRVDSVSGNGGQSGSSSDALGGGNTTQPTDNGSSAAEYDSDPEAVVPPEDTKPPPAHPVISVRKAEDLMISRPQVNGDDSAHFPCNDCPGMVFASSQELGQHQASHHQSSVQQLAQQVQRIPAQFQSPSYRVPTPPQRNQYMSPPPMVPFYPSGMIMPHEGTTQTIGSGVVLSTVSSQGVPNLPPGIQLSKRPSAQPPEAPSPKQRREEIETRRLPDSITLSRTPATPPSPARNSVTDLLANRGITVVPSGRSSNAPQSSSSTPTLPRSLSSAISITPSSQQQHRQSNFAVPAPKQVSRLLTVDLTKESDSPPRSRVMPSQRGRMRGPSTRSVCQICDKAFPTPQELQQHMACHRAGGAPNKLAYECRECTAQYPTEAGLQAHRQKYHGAGGPSPDMAIPVVDLKQVGVLSRLAALGIRSVIPLNQLHSGTGNGIFGLPVVAVDAANNPAICNIGGLGASNLLPLGPLKNLTFNNNLR